MIAGWFERVASSVPRGFSRYFILELLKEGPRTGKEMIDAATEQSQGIWKPSPGLIYPLLGRLLDEALIEEAGDGKYRITEKGRTTAADLEKIRETVKTQLDVLFRVGNAGQFIAMDILERISTMSSILGSNMENVTEREARRYKKFLESELKKVEAEIEKRWAGKKDTS